MRIARKIEAFAQIIALIAAGAFAIAAIVENDFFFAVILIQFLIGVEQYASAAISCLGKSSHWKEKAIHLKSATIYLVILFVGLGVDNVNSGSSSFWLPKIVIVAYVFVLPWSLAIYYAVITWKENFSKQNSGHFLPHTSF